MVKKTIRTCVYTRVKKEKDKLLRLVLNDNGEYILDENQKIQKRGIYLDTSKNVLLLLDKNKKYCINANSVENIKKIIENKMKVGDENVI